MKNILVILGHPNYESLNGTFFENYIKGAKKSGYNVKGLKLSNMKFDPILHQGYNKIQELELDLKQAQKDIKWADHIVFIFPTWWGVPPAILKGFIDRTILPGFAFKFKKNSLLWDKYLTSKTGRLIITTDSPKIFYKLLGSPGKKMMKNFVLKFIGFKKVKTTTFSKIRIKNKKQIKNHIKKVYLLGKKGI